MVFFPGEEAFEDGNSIDPRIPQWRHVSAIQFPIDHSHVEGQVVGNDDLPLELNSILFPELKKRGGMLHHAVVDSMNAGIHWRDGRLGIDKGGDSSLEPR